jgi:hypothetical protein
MCLKVVFTCSTFLGIGMFTASGDDWQNYVPSIFRSVGLNQVSSEFGAIFEIAAKVVFAMLF